MLSSIVKDHYTASKGGDYLHIHEQTIFSDCNDIPHLTLKQI